MIVRRNLQWSRILAYIGKELGFFLLYAAIIAVLYTIYNRRELAASGLPLGLIGAALSVFLAFRNNSAYDRWWEARTLWGGIVNASRTFARQILTFADCDEQHTSEETRAFQQTMIYRQIGYVHALRCHLRKEKPWDEIAFFFDPDEIKKLKDEQNVPAAILQLMAIRLKAAYRSKIVGEYLFVALDATLTEMTTLQGGCERIKNTPLARQYDYFPRIFVYTFCLLLPFGLVESLGLFTPLVTIFLTFIFLSLSTIGANVENPFENTINDTPMTALSRTIEINLRQQLGETDLPPTIEPENGFLY